MKLVIGTSEPSTTKIGSELIKLWQGAPYSHIYIRVYTKWTEKWLVYQASHGDVNCISYDNFKQNNDVFAEWELELAPEEHKSVVSYCQDNLQKSYGYLGLVKIVLAKKFKISGDGDRTFHCSELIYRAVPKIRDYINIKDADFIEPVHLVEALGKHPDAQRVL